MRALAVAGASLRRVARDRTALFFMVLLPVLVILVVGATVQGMSTFRVAVVDLGAGRSGAELVAALTRAPDLEVRHYAAVAAARTAVARGEVATAVVLPSGLDATVRAGGAADVVVLAERTNGTQQAAVAAVDAVVAAQGAQVQAAAFATAHGAGPYDRALALAGTLQRTVPQVRVVQRQVDSRAQTLPEGFRYSAPTMLVLFVFLNAVAGGAAVIETRRLGLYERMAASPVAAATVVLGETLGFFGIAVLQSVLIVAVGVLVFGVSWGSPPAAAALLAVWALVGAGAGMAAGTLFRTPEQATAVGPALGVAFGMLGGCMWPLSIVSGAMRQIGHATPQAWAVDAWTALVARDGTLGTIAPDLAVLLAFGAGLLTLASLRLRRVLT